MSTGALWGLPAHEHEPSAANGPQRKGGWSAWQRERLRGIEELFSGLGGLGRQPLLDALSAAIREAIAEGRSAAVVLLDINDFAEINATWGPDFGDEVLAAVGARIVEFTRERIGGIAAAPPVGRLDADHFAIIMEEMRSLEGLRDDTAELLRELKQPLLVSGQPVALGARAAIVQIPAHGRSLANVLGRGFKLLNNAARTRSDGVAASEADTSAGASTLVLERDLAAALATDQIFLALQPKVAAVTGAVEGAEALVRWQHPERGLLPPLAFIEAAEKSGLILELGLRVLQDVCRAGNALARFGKPMKLAVNVSPHQLAHPDFLPRFLEVIDREGVEPQKLEIEITESAAMAGGEHVRDSLHALRRCGIGIAIDDFGTGFSNLASLAALPADTLKIDRSLVVAGNAGGKPGALLAVAVQLGRMFGLATVAEGVETTEQYQHVTELGCDYVQGYFTGRPVRAGEFASYYLRR
jgi:diguanylate cyclase (GGDEF)-like protein